MHTELESLYVKIQSDWNELELEEFEKYLHPFTQEEERPKIIIALNNNIEITSGEFIYILNNFNEISLYDLEGNYIATVNYENINIINDKKTNIKSIWEVKTMKNNKLILKTLEN